MIVTAYPARYNLVATEQDMHPGEADALYLGGLYDVALSRRRALSGGRWPFSHAVPVRMMMGHTRSASTHLIMLVDLDHERPAAWWWGIIDHGRGDCVPAEALARVIVTPPLRYLHYDTDGDLCVGG